MATAETITLNAPHPPHKNALEAFGAVLHNIRTEIVKSRHHWDKHEPKMWIRAAPLSDPELVDFNLREDLVEIRSGLTAYGTVIIGKIRLPLIKDDEGEGFVHVRIHDPPDRGTEDVIFHSLFTYEGHKEGEPTVWRAIHSADTPLEFFNE